MKEWVKLYVKGCETCQQNKTNTRPSKPPLYPIAPQEGATPFSTIAMDWITKLPPSLEYNSILTIMDHNCSKVVLCSFHIKKPWVQKNLPNYTSIWSSLIMGSLQKSSLTEIHNL